MARVTSAASGFDHFELLRSKVNIYNFCQLLSQRSGERSLGRRSFTTKWRHHDFFSLTMESGFYRLSHLYLDTKSSRSQSIGTLITVAIYRIFCCKKRECFCFQHIFARFSHFDFYRGENSNLNLGKRDHIGLKKLVAYFFIRQHLSLLLGV